MATVKGGLFAQYSSTHSLLASMGAGRRRAAMALGRKGLRALRELMTTLNGAAAGSAALATQARIQASSELGGKRVIETETLVDRNTTAADVTEIDATVLSLNSKTHDPTPVANKDGNPLGTR